MEVLNRIHTLLILVVSLKFGFTVNPFLRFESVNVLKDKICPDADVIFTKNYLGYGEVGLNYCLTLCVGTTECNSIFYNKNNSICNGCSGSYDASSTLDVSFRTTYFKRISKGYMQNCYPGDVCVGDNQECFKNTCICSPGLTFNPSNNTCVTDCEAYGTTFQAYPQHRISGNNLFSVLDFTLQECFDMCISTPGCVSLDYGTMNNRWRCNIQAVTVLTLPDKFTEMVDFTYYARDCA